MFMHIHVHLRSCVILCACTTQTASSNSVHVHPGKHAVIHMCCVTYCGGGIGCKKVNSSSVPVIHAVS